MATREEVEQFLGTEEGTKFIQEKGLITKNKDTISKLIEEDKEFVSIKDSLLDKGFNHHLELKRKSGYLFLTADEHKNILNEAIKKANPQETAEQKQLRELTEKMEATDKKAKIYENREEARKIAKDFDLPDDFIDLMVNEDLELTTANIKKYGGIFKATFEKYKTDFEDNIKKGSHKPAGAGGNASTLEELKKQLEDAKTKGNGASILRLEREIKQFETK